MLCLAGGERRGAAVSALGGSEGDEERLGEVGLPRLEKRRLSQGTHEHLIGGVDKTEPGSFQFCPVRDQS